MTILPKPQSPTTGLTLPYDAWNRLVNVAGTALDVDYEYDGLNRLIVRDNGAETRHYYYIDEWQVLVEATGTTTQTADAMYSYHPQYVDAVACRMRDADCHVYLADANWNVTSVLDATSASSPAVVERYNYTPYGEVTIMNASFTTRASSLIANNYRYTGRWLDPDTGLQLNRNRWYASHLGRWVSRDPAEYEGSPYNLYEYVVSRPTFYEDPMGLQLPNPWNPPYQPGFPPFGPGNGPLPQDWFCENDDPPCDDVLPWDIVEEGEKRRGSKGPNDGSSHHCWAACMCSQISGGIVGLACAGGEAITEFPVAWWYGWHDTGDDIRENFKGACCGAVPSSCPSRHCDECCGTRKQ